MNTRPPLGKVMDLDAAVERFIKPGLVLHAGNGWAYPTAAIFAIARRFWGQAAGLTFVSTAAGAVNLAPLLAAGAVRKVITSFYGDTCPYPGPNRAIQEALATEAVAVEEWSMLTLTLRLMAAAMGLPFLPTRSLLGSDMLGPELPAARLDAGLPAAEPVALVGALQPDISLAHGWLADRDGNTVINPPYAAGVWGALAARQGTVVTVERVVAPAVLERFSHLVRIPAARVLAVVEAPFGAHPGGHHHGGMPEGGGYAEDQDFMLEAREACRTPAGLHEWARTWVLDTGCHEGYLQRLGSGRLAGLRGKLYGDAARLAPGQDAAPTQPAATAGAAPPTAAERMMVFAARTLTRRVQEQGYRSFLAGIGAAHLAAWLARRELSAAGVSVDLLSEVGMYGYDPLPGDPYLFALSNLGTAALHTDNLHVLGVFGTHRTHRSLGVLGAAQVDRHGRINTSRTAGGRFLVGSGGACDIVAAAAEVMVVAEMSPNRYVETLPYVTSPGRRTLTLVSQLGILSRRDPEAPFALTAYYREPGASDQAVIAAVRAGCGWDLDVAADARPLAPPTPAELAALRRWDPQGFFRGVHPGGQAKKSESGPAAGAGRQHDRQEGTA